MQQPELPIDRFEIHATGLDHPECLAFDRHRDIWAGGEAGQLYRIAPDRSVTLIADLGGFTGGVAISPNDDAIFVCNPKHGVARVSRDGSWSVFASAAGPHRLVCPNYGLFDAQGRYWLTDSGNWRKENGYLLRFDSTGACEVIAGPFGFANGLALSPDQRTIYMAESDKDRVLAIDTATAQARVHVTGAGRMPDGLAFSPAGDLYVSCYASDDIHRITPEGEPRLFAWDRWAILLNRPTNIAFHDGYLYVANFGRNTIVRARL